MADWDGSRIANWGPCEYGGTFTHKPPVSTVIQEAASIDGIKPPAGCDVMQKVLCRPRDGHYGSSTGYRTLNRQAEPIPMRGPGYESYIGLAVRLPKSYPGGANMWVAPFEWHQTSPGGVTGVAPSHLIFTGSGLDFDVRGGPTKQSGGIGNPGAIKTYAAHYPINERDVWHLPVLYYKHGAGDGAFQLFYAQIGRDKELTPLTPLITGKYTMFKDLLDYLLFNLYRQDSGNGDTEYYIAGLKEKTKWSDMLSWAHTMLGTPVVEPGPDPVPIPTDPGKITVHASIQKGDHLNAGSRYTVMVDSTGLIDKMRFYLDGVQFDEDPDGDLRGGRFVTGLNLTTTPVGAHTFGFASIGVDGKEIPAGTFKSYAITVDPKPIVPKTNVEHRDAGIEFLKKTTETFSVWNARTPAKKIGTNWANALDEFAQIK